MSSTEKQPTTRPYRGMAPEDRRREQRDRLINAARDVFASRGYAAAGVDEIVAQAHVSRTSFYEFFANKEQCLLTVFQVGAQRVAEALMAVIGLPLEPAERIRAEIEVLATQFAADPAMARVLLIEAVGATPAVESVRVEARQAAADMIEAQLREYPEWREDAHERQVVAMTSMAAIAESLSHLVATGQLDDWPSIVEPVSRYVSRGLGATPIRE